MTLVFGIDPSSKKLALCITDGLGETDKPELHKINLPAGVYRATGHAYREVFSCLEHYPADQQKIYLESPLVGRSAHATIVQSQVGGAVMAAAENCGVPVYLVNVSSWKKRVVGNGRAQKPEVARWLQKFWPAAYNLCSGDQDLIDACALNRYGVMNQRLAHNILTRSTRGSKAQGEEGRAVRRRQPHA